MKKSKRIKQSITVPPPVTRAEAEALVNELAITVNSQRQITACMDAEILTIRDAYASELSLYGDTIAAYTARLEVWASANPSEFGKAKSLQFPAGTIGFRTGMPKLALALRKWTWKQALAAVQSFLPNFIRSIPEIDAEALIAQREEEPVQAALKKCGLKVVQDESFYVDPNIESVKSRQTAEVTA